MTFIDLGGSLRLAFASEATGVPAPWLELLRSLDRNAFPHDDAFTRDLTALAPHMKRLALRLTGNLAAAEDLVQDTLVRAWSYRHRFELGSNMKAWTSTIMRRLYLSDRKRDRHVGVFDDELERSLSYDENQTATVMLGSVAEAIGDLKPEYRVALTTVVLDEMSYDEAAAKLDVPVGTVKSRVARARRALNNAFDDDMAEPAPAFPTRPAKPGLTWRQAKALGIPFMIG